MGKLDKDLLQKEMAVRFCLVNNLIPFLEVDVQNYRELSDVSTTITDIDALGVSIDSAGKPRKVIFDCKTLKNTSPVNRAFWASGLMQFTGCTEAFIILSKKASEAHRFSAKRIGVHLFNDKQFINYAESCSQDFNIDYCYSTNIDSWIALENVSTGNIHFEQYMHFLCNEIPLENDSVKGFRRLLAATRKIKGEFDPAKAKHRAVFFYSVAMLAFTLSQIVHDLRNIIDFNASEKVFEKTLKYYVWGGKDSFELRNKLQSIKKPMDLPENELKLKDWDKFIELVRNLMDSPSDISECIAPMREFGMLEVVARMEVKDLYLKDTIKSNNRVRQFCTFIASYLIGATDLPRDMMDKLNDSFEELLK
ncbi:hypothetical protein KUC3_31570 [Alteromonas sp. KC3]|uniref:hypothetical protein n=1 Tax=unclassified Alteromonas TaxID=2614992 RepID=UPI00192394B5|nr:MULTISPECIES: hypothetical protein [unclassified Alteromonas]BCO20300.1 hypothetical protein KUC3_31570 [Alteromonas sp. KC3]BCO24266.1 hypothetical protein KUC14_31350 [Alteromonas sp. KC14]